MRTGFLGLFCLVLTLGCNNVPAEPAAEQTVVVAEQAVAAVEQSVATHHCVLEAPLVIDVRSDGEFYQGHVRDAINIPYTRIADEIGEHTRCEDCKVLLYCRSGARADVALNNLVELGYTDVENLGSLENARMRVE